MPDGNDLLLINAAIDATVDECQHRGLPLTGVTRRLFALVDSGERDFDVLKAAALGLDADVVKPASSLKVKRTANRGAARA